MRLKHLRHGMRCMCKYLSVRYSRFRNIKHYSPFGHSHLNPLLAYRFQYTCKHKWYWNMFFVASKANFHFLFNIRKNRKDVIMTVNLYFTQIYQLLIFCHVCLLFPCLRFPALSLTKPFESELQISWLKVPPNTLTSVS